jgi:RIO kinase 1
MEYIGGLGQAAPTLNSVALSLREARAHWETIYKNIDLLLNLGFVHGDLSAYNLLYWDRQVWLIDFPQAMPADSNQNAWPIFERDMVRLCGYFNRQGMKLDGKQVAKSIWKKYPYPIPRQELPERYFSTD